MQDLVTLDERYCWIWFETAAKDYNPIVTHVHGKIRPNFSLTEIYVTVLLTINIKQCLVFYVFNFAKFKF